MWRHAYWHLTLPFHTHTHALTLFTFYQLNRFFLTASKLLVIMWIISISKLRPWSPAGSPMCGISYYYSHKCQLMTQCHFDKLLINLQLKCWWRPESESLGVGCDPRKSKHYSVFHSKVQMHCMNQLNCFNHYFHQDCDSIQQTVVSRVEPPDPEVGCAAGHGHTGHQWHAHS